MGPMGFAGRALMCFAALVCPPFPYFFFYDIWSHCISVPCRSGPCVDQTGFKRRDLPASTSQVLGSKMCATTPGFDSILILWGKRRIEQN